MILTYKPQIFIDFYKQSTKLYKSVIFRENIITWDRNNKDDCGQSEKPKKIGFSVVCQLFQPTTNRQPKKIGWQPKP